MLRVVIADDHALFREGLCSLLARSPEIEVVGQASNGSEALDLVVSAEADILLLDLRMPEVDGLEVLTRLGKRGDACRVIVLSMEDRRFAESLVLEKGACAYIEKTADLGDLVVTIKNVAARAHVSKERGSDGMAPARERELLSPRQFQVLRLLVEGKSNSEIAAELWISERTVKHHVTWILKRLGVQRRAQAIAIATGRTMPDRMELDGAD